MVDWLSEHAELLSLAVNAGMLAVWLTYLNVFLMGYRRQVRPKIVINRGGSEGLDARCFISNMSQDPIYIEDIVVTVEAGERCWRSSVTDVDGPHDDIIKSDPKAITRQGPLPGGGYMEVGSYGDLITRVLKPHCDGGMAGLALADGEAVRAQVEVIADHAAEDLLIAARRRFALHSVDGEWLVRPLTVQTEQVRSATERHHLETSFRKEIEAA